MIKANLKKGFTLLEMLVSLGIFTVVAVVAVGSLLKIVALNRQAQTLQSSMTSLASALEAISREMRIGQAYDCVNVPADINWDNTNSKSLQNRSCDVVSNPTSDRLVAFESQYSASNGSGGTCNLIYAYWFKWNSGNPSWTLKKYEQNNCGNAPAESDYYEVFQDDAITLTTYGLGVYRPDSTQGSHAWAFVRLKGYAGLVQKERERHYFDVQTSVSERLPD